MHTRQVRAAADAAQARLFEAAARGRHPWRSLLPPTAPAPRRTATAAAVAAACTQCRRPTAAAPASRAVRVAPAAASCTTRPVTQTTRGVVVATFQQRTGIVAGPSLQTSTGPRCSRDWRPANLSRYSVCRLARPLLARVRCPRCCPPLLVARRPLRCNCAFMLGARGNAPARHFSYHMRVYVRTSRCSLVIARFCAIAVRRWICIDTFQVGIAGGGCSACGSLAAWVGTGFGGGSMMASAETAEPQPAAHMLPHAVWRAARSTNPITQGMKGTSRYRDTWSPAMRHMRATLGHLGKDAKTVPQVVSIVVRCRPFSSIWPARTSWHRSLPSYLQHPRQAPPQPQAGRRCTSCRPLGQRAAPSGRAASAPAESPFQLRASSGRGADTRCGDAGVW